MDLKQFIVLIVMLLSINTVRADLYLEASAETGGDKLVTTNSVDSISAGGGLKVAIGVQNSISEDGSAAIRLSVGYLFDSIVASNGEADFSTMTFDALYIINSGPHSFGVGGTMHMSPEYSDNVDGYWPVKVEYEDAVGLLLQYGYHFVPGLELGFRYTDLQYESATSIRDASSFGIFISNGF